ncbi:MAG: addiction module protein [Propionibacteriaceae bacterium]|nr:addiction module protein [Propionibacteriaceae bacterium]
MSLELLELVEAGRELSREDRYELAHQMLVSVDEAVDDPGAVEESWKAELRQRIRDIENDPSQLVDGRETIRQAREFIAQRRETTVLVTMVCGGFPYTVNGRHDW